MEQLRDVVSYLLRCADERGVGKTVLTKLVYFAELESWEKDGRALTGTQFYRYTYGAWSPAVADIACELPFVEHKRRFVGLYPENRFYLGPDAPPERLTERSRELLGRVFAMYGKWGAAAIGRVSKISEPMLIATGQMETLDLSVVRPQTVGLRVRDSRLAAASGQLDRAQRGTRAEINARDEAEMKAWDPLRQRAASGQ